MRVASSLALVVLAATAQAETKAEALFEKGRTLAKAGNYDAACKAFAESHAIDPQFGVLFNLADCNVQIGKLATALGMYRELARLDNYEPRRQKSAELADAIGKRVPKLIVKIDAHPGLALSLDNTDITNVRSLEVPVDLGKHKVIARANGYETQTREISVEKEATVYTLDFVLVKPTTTGTVNQPPPPSIDKPPARPTPSSSGKVITIIGANVTVIGLGVGAYAASEYASAQDDIDNGAAEANEQVKDAQLLGNISTALVGGGIVTTAIGLYLWNDAHDDREKRAWRGKVATIAGSGMLVLGLGAGYLAQQTYDEAKDEARDNPRAANHDVTLAQGYGNVSTVLVAAGAISLGIGIYLWRSSDTTVTATTDGVALATTW